MVVPPCVWAISYYFFLCLLLKAQNALTGHCGKEQMNRTEIETEARCETAMLK